MQGEIYVYVLADYGGTQDLAFAEVSQRLYSECAPLPISVHKYAVPAFDTYATGFALAQLAINSRLAGAQKFFVNTAPRKDDLTPRQKNAGEGFAYVRLQNGVEICAVNSGYSLSFVKDAAAEIREIKCDRAGSQFRSRDIFPEAFARVLKGDTAVLGDDIVQSVPDRPENVLCYTDGYGNLKCAIDPAFLDAHRGQSLMVEINGHSQKVKVSEGIFGVADGDFCFSPGSSGWALPDGRQVRFCEIVRRGGSAASVFGHPQGGAKISVLAKA
ncbi:MAG: hypothetical protein V4621_03370 [Pseudomonadota bacterium]